MFKSNRGILINADVNAAYQIMKVGGYKDLSVKEKEKVIRLNVA
jgi:putative transposase